MTRPYNDRHYSKNKAFHDTCGKCGKPLPKKSKNKVGFLCRKCGPPYKRDIEIVNSCCYHCEFELDCIARVQLGIWVRCETPDYGDLERVNYACELNDAAHDELLKAMKGKGIRKALEDAITQGACKEYQSSYKNSISNKV